MYPNENPRPAQQAELKYRISGKHGVIWMSMKGDYCFQPSVSKTPLTGNSTERNPHVLMEILMSAFHGRDD